MTVLKYYNESTSQWEPLVIGAQGPTGPQGIQGIQGVPGADGEGVPAGGTTDQVLAKVDGTDYNTAWVDAGGGGMTLLSTTTLSGTTMLISGIPSDYENLQINIYKATAAATFSLEIYASVDDEEASTGTFGESTSIQNDSRGAIYLGSNLNATNTNNAWTVIYTNYAKNTYHPWQAFGAYRDASNAFTSRNLAGGNIRALDFGAFYIKSSSSLTGGTVEVWGVK